MTFSLVIVKKYIVNLSEQELAQIQTLLRSGKAAARTLARARVLLMSHEGYIDSDIAKVLHLHVATVERTRRRWVDGSLEDALYNRPILGAKPKLAPAPDAALVALACTGAPSGRTQWTMQLLADELVRLQVVDKISDETVRRTLKKTTLSLG